MLWRQLLWLMSWNPLSQGGSCPSCSGGGGLAPCAQADASDSPTHHRTSSIWPGLSRSPRRRAIGSQHFCCECQLPFFFFTLRPVKEEGGGETFVCPRTCSALPPSTRGSEENEGGSRVPLCFAPEHLSREATKGQKRERA